MGRAPALADEPRAEAGLFPALLRHWRRQRGRSQLDVALDAGVSTRHLSFLETGRAGPSREMVLRLGGALAVPLRDQNRLLDAAGFAPEFPEPDAAGPLTPAIEQALARMLAQQEPYPLTVLDRRYDIVRANAAAMRILPRFVADPITLRGPLNVFRMLFDARMGRRFVDDWERVARELVGRLQREVLSAPEDDALRELLAELRATPDVPARVFQPDLTAPSGPTLAIRLRRDDLVLGFFTTITTFNAPHDVTLEELRIESYFPLDDATATACAALAAAG
ncbi:MAG: helix-turn-helix transcriptional regulator [Polyangiales bacterium]|nr:helix-turn-helix transcriptional regulator [Myxococcales bacterium]MCB9656944.1 helix-turn-helix transcriptional regulator [Sandaracinaceae bacterium]